MAEQKRIWDNYTVVCVHQTEAKVRLEVGLGSRDGVKNIVIHTLRLNKEGEWYKTQQYVVIPIETRFRQEAIFPLDSILDTIRVAKIAAPSFNIEGSAVYLQSGTLPDSLGAAEQKYRRSK